MKHLDQFSQRVLAISLSIMGLLLCSSLFIATISPANASNNFVNTSSAINPPNQSHIMMDYSSVHVPSQDKTYYECIVWDTQTGVSKLYFYDYSTKTFKAYAESVQLPHNPLD